LSHIILKLSDAAKDRKDISHLPYRDSKLTRILKPALDGDSRMSIICTLTPSAVSFGESLNTLKFASRAKRIESRAVANRVEDETALIIRYQHEIAKLKSELEVAKMESKSNKSGGKGGGKNGGAFEIEKNENVVNCVTIILGSYNYRLLMSFIES
jgi:centromeric protein E